MGGANFIAKVLAITTGVSAFSLPPTTRPLDPTSNSHIKMTTDATAAAAAAAVASTPHGVRPRRVAVIGGGPAGALAALYLSRSGGFEVDVFEAFEEDRIAGPTSRSWNVILFERGRAALEEGGFDLQKEVGDLVITVGGSVRHHAEKKYGEGIATGSKSVCRGDLAKSLLNKARQAPNVNIHFGCTFSGMDMEKRVAVFERGNGETFESSFDMLVGADGVNSRVRRTLEDSVPDFTVRQREGPKVFKTFTVPIMEMEGAEEIWKTCIHGSNSKKSGNIVGSPRSDGVITATLILFKEGEQTFEKLMKTTKDVRELFGKDHPGLFGPEGPSEEIAKSFLEQRVQRPRTIYCSHLAVGNVVLIGDAGHAMEASLGQGVNCALEDCRVLGQAIASEAEKTGSVQGCDIPTVLEAYNKLRLEDAHAVCKLSEIGGVVFTKKTLLAQVMLAGFLNKTLGRVLPKIFPPPALFGMNKKHKPYRMLLQAFEREGLVARGLFLSGLALVLASVARRTVLRV